MTLTESWSQDDDDDDDDDDSEQALVDVAMDATMIATKKQVIVSQLLQRLTSLLDLPVDSLSTLTQLLHGGGGNNESDTSSGSLTIPGLVPFRCDPSTGTSVAAGKSPLFLQAGLSRVSIHWTWQERESSPPSRPLSCLLNLLAKEGDALVFNEVSPGNSGPTNTTNALLPSIHLEGLQFSIEQQEREGNSEAGGPFGNNSSPAPPIRIFVKLDKLDWIKAGQIHQMNLWNVTLSGVIRLDASTTATAASLTTIDQVQLTCPQMLVRANASSTGPSHTTTTKTAPSMTKTTKTAKMVDMLSTRNDDRDNHMFLSALLRVLNRVDTPCAVIANRIPVTINITDTTESSNIESQDAFLPPFTTSSPKTMTLGDLMRHLYLNMEDAATTAIKAAVQNNPASSKNKDNDNKMDIGGDTKKGLRLPKIAVGDSLATSAALLATGASFVSPVGAAVSVAAVGVKDGVTAAAQAGKQERGATSEDGYKFGDIARGVVATVQKRRQERQQGTVDRNSAGTDQASFLEQNQRRYAGVVGSSVGAAVGLTLVGGPIGFVAGSLLGGHATQKQMAKRNSTQNHNNNNNNFHNQSLPTSVVDDLDDTILFSNDDELIMQQLQRAGHRENQPREREQPQRAWAGDILPNSNSSSQQEQQRPYQLGDNIRGVIARGKQVRGDQQESQYRFGDFTRGLFAQGPKSS